MFSVSVTVGDTCLKLAVFTCAVSRLWLSASDLMSVFGSQPSRQQETSNSLIIPWKDFSTKMRKPGWRDGRDGLQGARMCFMVGWRDGGVDAGIRGRTKGREWRTDG